MLGYSKKTKVEWVDNKWQNLNKMSDSEFWKDHKPADAKA
jgi:hypothetical protein